MICPNCSSQLISVSTKGAVLDTCPECKGIWFDSGEFGGFMNRLSRSDKVEPAKVQLFKRRQVEKFYPIKEAERSCPKCKTKMVKFNYAYDSNVMLDKCPQCQGIWADAGESKLIAGYLKDNPEFEKVAKLYLACTIDVTEKIDEDIAMKVGKTGLFFLPRLIVPFSDDIEREKTPMMTVSLMVICVTIYLINATFNPWWILDLLNFIPEKVTDIFRFDILGSMFSQGGVFHLAWNMLFLWLFGDNVEDRFSRFGYLIFFIFCGAVSVGIYSVLGTDIPAAAIWIGGAVSGVMGAYLIFYPAANIEFFVAGSIKEVPVILCFAAWFLFQFLYPFVFKAEASAISICFSHISGFVIGLSIGCMKKVKAGALVGN